MLNSTPTYFRLSIKHWNTLIYLLICLFSSIPTYTKVGVHPPFADRNKQKSFSGSISLTVVVSSTQNLKKNVPYSVFITKSNKYFFETIQDSLKIQGTKSATSTVNVVPNLISFNPLEWPSSEAMLVSWEQLDQWENWMN